MQIITAKGHDIISECQDVMSSQHERVNELKTVVVDMLEMFALRQTCSALKEKIFREVAGERHEAWDDLYLNSFQDLKAETMQKDTKNEDDLQFFQQRWAALRRMLQINEIEDMLRRMYSVCVEDCNQFAHGEYGYTADELANHVLMHCKKPQVSRGLRRFLELNTKLSELRGESIYKCNHEKHMSDALLLSAE